MKNFGKTSLDEISEKLQEHGERLGRDIHLGMDLSDYISAVWLRKNKKSASFFR